MGMNNEPPRRQELSFSIKRENKIIPLSLQRLDVNSDRRRIFPMTATDYLDNMKKVHPYS